MPSRSRRLSFPSSSLPLRSISYRAPSSRHGIPANAPSALVLRPTHRRAASRGGVGPNQPASVLVTVDHMALTLPIPPSINKHYATVNGRRLLSSAGRAFKAQAGQQVWIALAQSPLKDSLLRRLQSEPLALSIHFYFTTALRRDLDSGLKITQDAICEGLGLNDNRIIETHLYKHVDKLNPRIEVVLSLASPVSRTFTS